MNTELCKRGDQHKIGLMNRYIFSIVPKCSVCSKQLVIRPTITSSIILFIIPISTFVYLYLSSISAINFNLMNLLLIWVGVSLISRSKMIFSEKETECHLGKPISILNIFSFVFFVVMVLVLSELFDVSTFIALNMAILPLAISPPLFDLKKDQIIDF
jgi:hypothetical protein